MVSEEASDALVEIFRADGEMEAELVRSLLDSCGIESIIAGGSFRVTHIFTLYKPGLVRILVRVGDAERAKEVLNSSFAPLEEVGEGDEEKPD